MNGFADKYVYKESPTTSVDYETSELYSPKAQNSRLNLTAGHDVVKFCCDDTLTR